MVKPKKLKFKDHKVADSTTLKLDLGTGKGGNRPEGFVGVDIVKHDGVEVVHDLRTPWPWADESVDEVQCFYMLQFFNAEERKHFVHELFRVLKPAGKATIVVPHWASARAYGDPVAAWPPISEAWFGRLDKTWREAQNYDDPNGYTCDFVNAGGYLMHPEIAARNDEYKRHALAFFKEAAQDFMVTLTKR